MQVPNWLKVLVSAALLVWLVQMLSMQGILGRLGSVRPAPVAVAVGLLAAVYITSGLRWAWIAEGLGIAVSRARKVQLFFVGMFASLFLPSTIGGDVVRAVMLARGREGMRARAMASVVLDRANGLLMLVALLGVAWLASGRAPLWPGAALLGVAALAAAMPRLLAHLPGLRTIPLAEARFQRAWLAALPASALVQAGVIGAHAALGGAVGLVLAWHDWVLVVGLAALAAALPISFNGLGVREASYVGLAAWAGGDPEAAAAMAALWLFVLAITALPGGVLLWRSSRAS